MSSRVGLSLFLLVFKVYAALVPTLIMAGMHARGSAQFYAVAFGIPPVSWRAGRFLTG